MIFNMTAAGSELNFRLCASLLKPENPKENTLWLCSDTPLTSWIFAPTEPENPSEGMAWIQTQPSSSAPFNALKKNGIILCPTGVKQYVSGLWQAVEAEVFTGGSWQDFMLHLLAKSGAEEVTGAWLLSNSPDTGTLNHSLTVDENGLYLSVSSALWTFAVTEKPIQMDDFKVLYFKVESFKSGWTGPYVALCSTNSRAYNSTILANCGASQVARETRLFALDVSGLTGPWYPKVMAGNSSNIRISQMYLGK